jgi:uncharacterized protein YqhQ
MANEPLRLGGMALPNGVLVHGPRAWACAVRDRDGELRVASGYKRFRASAFEGRPLLRGPAKLAEVFAFMPALRRKLPQARLPMERPSVLAAMAASAFAVRVVRDNARIGPAAKELVAGLLSLAPAILSLRTGELAAYHGAEHVSIGTYEHGEPHAKEHERCGSHLVGPLIGSMAVGASLAARVPRAFQGPARLAAQLGSVAAAMEIFNWMVRHPDHALSKALARPGHELQHRLATAEPTPAQLEVAEAALRECLRLEGGDRDS